MLYFSRWKTILIWLAVLASIAAAAPNLFTAGQLASLPGWFPHRKLTLGLDLRGGTRLALQIERDDILTDRLQWAAAATGRRLRDAGIRYSDLSGSGQAIQVRITDPGQLPAALTALKPLTDSLATAPGGTIREVTATAGEAGLVTLGITDEGIAYRISQALNQSVEIIRRRIEEIGYSEPLVQRQGTDRIVVQVAGLTDPQRLKMLLNQPGKLTFNMIDASMPVQTAIDSGAPANSEVLYSQDDPPEAFLVVAQPVASGANLIDAQQTPDPQTGQQAVIFRFDPQATRNFADVTAKNVGRPYVIVLDDQVISAPIIKQPILDGIGTTPGNFSAEGAADLVVLLRSGALPATLTVVEERTVGPGLGADSIRAGIIAGIIGALAVVGFMLFFYGFLGAFATAALVFNIILILAVLTLFGFTLTLPGIAGIIFTIGIAVDSNVLIYERIREELKSGHTFPQSSETGFSKAFITIVDANVTLLIAAIILYYMGSGPVRGFAVALAIGILATLFTAFTLTRWLISAWIARRHPKHMPRSVRSGMFDDANIRFMGIRRYTFTASAVLSLIAMTAFFSFDMHLGIDFTGGSIIEVRAKQASADLADIRARLGELNLGEIQVQGIGGSAGALIRIQAQDGGENAEQSAVTLVRGELEDAYEFRRVEAVGPAVSGQLTRSATIGVLASLAVILIYIWLRFAWQFAVGAIVATLHDIILTLGLFALTGIEFNLTSIAAVLTIIGYSLNDTMVVYDRMRENLRRYGRMPLPLLIDASINQTLSRTILTSAATLLALAALCLFGGEVIRSFTLAMLFGVAVGTFSSIYIAAPVLIVFKLRPDSIRGNDGKRNADADVQSGNTVV